MVQSLNEFNLSKVWDRSVELVMANAQLLAIIAGVFMLVPTLVMYLAVPELATMATMQPEPGANPEEIFEQFSETYGEMAPFGLVGFLLSIIAYSSMVALMGENGVTVGEAIVRGAKSIPTFIAVFILFLIAYFIAIILVFVPAGLFSMLGSAGAAIGGILGFIAAIAMTFFMIARFSVVLPIIILEKTLNPFTAILRSWKLTAPKQWAITGFWALILIVYFIIAIVVGGILGVVAALGSGATSALIMGIFNGLLGVVVAMLFSGIVVALYQGLTGATAESVSEAFE